MIEEEKDLLLFVFEISNDSMFGFIFYKSNF